MMNSKSNKSQPIRNRTEIKIEIEHPPKIHSNRTKTKIYQLKSLSNQLSTKTLIKTSFKNTKASSIRLNTHLEEIYKLSL